MNDMVLAVHASQYGETVGTSRFVGLPTEELDRLYGTVDVIALSRAQAADPAYLPLATYTTIHYNYAWLTHGHSPRALGIGELIAAERDLPLFLDHALQVAARAAVKSKVSLNAPCDWRLAGLIHDTQLVLVYIARLRQRSTEARSNEGTELRFSGNGELLLERGDFDAISQVLIDNLSAL